MNVSDVLTCKIASCEKRIYLDQLAQTHNIRALAAPANSTVGINLRSYVSSLEERDNTAQHRQIFSGHAK